MIFVKYIMICISVIAFMLIKARIINLRNSLNDYIFYLIHTNQVMLFLIYPENSSVFG